MQKPFRLTQRASFSYIYKHGSKAYNELFSLYYVEAYNLKLGVSVNKKVGNSVVRNKVKRRIKEAFREIIPIIKPKYNIVIVARQGIDRALYSDIKQGLIRIFQKENLLAHKGDFK